MAKNLVAKSAVGVTSTTSINVNEWATLNNAGNFINHLETTLGNASNNSIEVFNTVVSGVPSPWARVNLTSYALSDHSEINDTRILTECYRRMRSEWRGLIAAYILNPDRFKLSKPIALKGKAIDENRGQLDILTVLGKMLFNDSKIWAYSADDSTPYIQLLYYSHDGDTKTKPMLIGATSPSTLFFLSSNYAFKKGCAQELFWINHIEGENDKEHDGKFTDPTSSCYTDKIRSEYLNSFKKIVAFLKNISANTETYKKELEKVVISGNDRDREKYEAKIDRIIDGIRSFVDDWLDDFSAISPEFNDVDKNNIPVSISSAAMPQGPLNSLFNLKYTYYWFDRTFWLSKTNDKAIEIADAQDLFINSKYLLGFKSAFNDKFENAPVTYIKATDENKQDYYCAIPFSRFAIEECLKDEVVQITRGESENVKLINTVKGNIIKITLQAKFSSEGEFVDIISKEYTIIEPDSIGYVATWPNFQSKIWNKYYFYSEYPTNSSGIRVMPVFGHHGERIAIDFESLKINNLEENIKDMYLVRYPIDKVNSSAHRYEIIRSEYPISFLSIKVDRDDKEHSAGYLLVKTNTGSPTSTDSMYIKNISVDSLTPASVGIDFGSTNTCAYYSNGESAQAIPFTNRRLALIGFENTSGMLAQKNELYFISNESPINKNGQVKSWLHLHHPDYYESAKSANELVGGVPINETNISVKSITENEITTNAGTLCSNMKWLSDKKGIDCKNSYMATTWLQICADLFDFGYKPEKLYWSYPSAMSKSDITSMKKIYKNLKNTTIIKGNNVRSIESHTESEAVCSYAMTKEVALTEKRLFLGIDIGGSTSDILIMGRQNGEIQLFTQCSLRIAANHFFQAINSSERFRKALYKFHNSSITKVRVMNIEDVISSDANIYSRSPYYLNNIFDQLSGTDFYNFYNSLNQSVPFAFTLPAYITGVLVFYAGLLVRNAIKTNSLDSIEQVNMRYYGKGGRTFEWIISIYEDEAKSFYKKCFQAGFGDDPIRFKCDNINELEAGNTQENKSEVAMGLVNIKRNIKGIYNSDDEDDITTPIEFLSEVFGEPGFSYIDKNGNKQAINELDIVNGEFYYSLDTPDEFKNFYKFIDIFGKFLVDTGIADIDLVKTLRNNRCKIDNVMQFFDNDKEYAKYQNDLDGANDETKPSYRMPVFIAEALYYLDKVLLNNVFKD